MTLLGNIIPLIAVYYLITRIAVPLFKTKRLWIFGLIIIIFSFWLFLIINRIAAFIIAGYVPLGNDEISGEIRKIIHEGFIASITPGAIFRNIINILGIIALPLLVKLIIEISKEYKRTYELKKQKLEMEVAFLKSQLNPHFLFNTLNNIYALVATQNPLALSVILKLSDIMRYTLYETDQEKVLLKDEFAFLASYIELERIRNENLIVEVHNGISENNKEEIIPLITFPFIENAFKYALKSGKGEKTHIYISFFIQESVFYFKIRNEKEKHYDDINQKKKGGIGIANTKNRLNLQYPGKHLLEIKNSDEMFEVSLQIELL